MLPTFEVFGLSLPMFGVMMMCGMIAAFVLLLHCRKYVLFSEDELLSAALWAIILGFVGSKLLFWLVEIDQIIADPRYLLHTLREGFVFYGSLIGGLLGLFIHARRTHQPFFAYMDLFIPCLTLGQAFGRIGCFFAGCCYGSPSSCAIAVTFPSGGAAPAGVPLLPTQLMESAFLFLLTIALVQLLKRHKPFVAVSAWYLLLYGVWRFIIEFFRSDERGFIGALSTSQFIGIFIVLAGVVLLVLLHKGVLSQAALAHPAAVVEDDAPLFPDESEPEDVTQDEMVLLVSEATRAAQQQAEHAHGAPVQAEGPAGTGAQSPGPDHADSTDRDVVDKRAPSVGDPPERSDRV